LLQQIRQCSKTSKTGDHLSTVIIFFIFTDA
jgi:hypothetical protein